MDGETLERERVQTFEVLNNHARLLPLEKQKQLNGWLNELSKRILKLTVEQQILKQGKLPQS